MCHLDFISPRSDYIPSPVTTETNVRAQSQDRHNVQNSLLHWETAPVYRVFTQTLVSHCSWEQNGTAAKAGAFFFRLSSSWASDFSNIRSSTCFAALLWASGGAYTAPVSIAQGAECGYLQVKSRASLSRWQHQCLSNHFHLVITICSLWRWVKPAQQVSVFLFRGQVWSYVKLNNTVDWQVLVSDNNNGKINFRNLLTSFSFHDWAVFKKSQVKLNLERKMQIKTFKYSKKSHSKQKYLNSRKFQSCNGQIGLAYQ